MWTHLSWCAPRCRRYPRRCRRRSRPRIRSNRINQQGPAIQQTWALFFRFTQREIKGRFVGSGLGLLWAILGPLLLLGIYSLVFGQLFEQRIGGLRASSYTLFVAVALWPWMMFAEGLTRGMLSIQANASLVKKVAFPHIVLVGSAVAAVFVLHGIGYICVLSALAIAGFPIKLAGVPVAMLYLLVILILTLGLASLLASLQTITRDVEQAVNPAIMMFHYLTPVLYPITLIPEKYRPWLEWNPMAFILERMRDGLLQGVGLGAIDLAPLLFAGLVLLGGAFVFSRFSPYFEDFL